jgi:organic radical activating enzyme
MTFDLEQISELFRSDNLYFRKIAAKMTVDDFDIHSNLFFDILSTDSECDDLIRYVRQRFLSLGGGFDKADVFIPSKQYLYFSKYAEDHALFMEKLQTYLCRETCMGKQKKLITNLSKRFEGLKSDLSHSFPQYCNSADSENTETHTDDRQLMIFITGKCNLSCPYCFSGELQPSEISPADLEAILLWASHNKIARISLCGGEPTSHKCFDEILLSIKKQGFKTYFASNFTIDCSAMKNFNTTVIEKIYIHLTGESWENPHLRTQLLKNVEYAKKAEIELTCRTNIADTNPPITEWFQFLQKTSIRTLNIALTFPTPKTNNQYVDIYSFEKYRPVIEEIIDKSKEQDIDLSFAKPVPLCIFGEQTNRYLTASENFYPLCNVNEQHCTRNLCINVQKEFHACLGVTSSALKFREDMEWQEVEYFCTAVIRPLLTKPLWNKCPDCFLFDRKLCQGACLSYKSIS